MVGRKGICFVVLAACLCLFVMGCASAEKKVKQADDWVQDNMW